MAFSQSLTKKLQDAFNPERLEVINESHLHAGHQEKFDGSGETHLRIRIVAEAFRGMSRLQRHRSINALAETEIAAGLHALAIEAGAPGDGSVR
ncbi:MAG: BolA family protein [Nitratireductor sp.]